MKQTIPLLLFIAISGSSLFTQNKITETEKLSTTAKIWGFLKYYHPNVVKGNYDWDNELVKRLSTIKKLQTRGELSNYFVEWITDLGKIKPSRNDKSSSDNDYFLKNLNLSWIQESSTISMELQSQLTLITNAYRGNKHHYVKLKKIGNSGKAEPKNEKEYDYLDYPRDENLRLLNLFRFWNFIEYFFPYKYQTDQDWDDVLFEMIPKFREANNVLDYHLAILELTVKLDDSHTNFTTSNIEDYFGRFWLPVSLKFIEGKAVVDGFYNTEYAESDNWNIGDVVTRFNGIEIQDLYKNSKQFLSGSNEKSKQHIASFKLFRSNEKSAVITVEKDGELINRSVSLFPLNEMKERNFNPVKSKIIDRDIGYINLGMVRVKEVSDVVQSVFNTKGLIIDIRNYPLGTKDAIVAELSKEPKDCFKSIMPDLTMPGRFIWRKGKKMAGRNNSEYYQGKIVLLVNEKTISYAELTCMCLQTLDDVTIIGSQTAGADGNVTELNLTGDYSTNISGIGMFYPNGKATQRIGIKPDIVVEQTIDGIKAGNDEVLEKAIEFLKK